MESFAIGISKAEVDDLAFDAGRFLTAMFNTSSPNYQTLAYEIQREFKQGGSPDVTSMTFDRVTYHPASGKGNFRVVLNIRYTFGCEDVVTEKTNQTSEWTFAVDAGNNLIRFYNSPFAEERSTADEF